MKYIRSIASYMEVKVKTKRKILFAATNTIPNLSLDMKIKRDTGRIKRFHWSQWLTTKTFIRKTLD